ncbi:hypothetical protein F511_38280 [Dorcoceras hygrometricum]|uniref:Uncharacterized protein n=1 Tax=Dorcoceras hygrometricum TaxID=472368 RepID=A0A2Z7B1L5_9LAMI|nr:hypothetical protein F511_38280 [Dorcoceras hygrometricum]
MLHAVRVPMRNVCARGAATCAIISCRRGGGCLDKRAQCARTRAQHARMGIGQSAQSPAKRARHARNACLYMDALCAPTCMIRTVIRARNLHTRDARQACIKRHDVHTVVDGGAWAAGDYVLSEFVF